MTWNVVNISIVSYSALLANAFILCNKTFSKKYWWKYSVEFVSWMFQSSWSTRNAFSSLLYYTLGTHPEIYRVQTPSTIHSQRYWQMLIFYVTKSLARIIGGHPQLNFRKHCVNIPDPLGMLCPDCSNVPSALFQKIIGFKRHQPSILNAIFKCLYFMWQKFIKNYWWSSSVEFA